MNNITPAMKTITRHLTPAEKQELMDVMDYLGEKAGPNGSGNLHEGSVASLFNKASPRVRGVLQTISTTMETPRVEPFAPHLDERQVAHGYGLDTDVAVTAKSALDGQHVLSSLQDRMGTDSQREPEPITTRDILSEAYDRHTEHEGADLD